MMDYVSIQMETEFGSNKLLYLFISCSAKVSGAVVGKLHTVQVFKEEFQVEIPSYSRPSR